MPKTFCHENGLSRMPQAGLSAIRNTLSRLGLFTGYIPEYDCEFIAAQSTDNVRLPISIEQKPAERG